jgi:branched-chain amino acid transport system permease protein
MDLTALVPYVLTIGTYFVIYNILTWGLNIQFGYAGIPNFTYITFMAAGAYFAGVIDLPHSTSPYLQYILGLGLPFPLSLLGGAAIAGVLGLLLGLVVLTRLRSDYLAIVTFSLGFIAYDVVSSYHPLFNGFDGLSGVSQPLNTFLNLDYNTYQWFFLGLAAVIMVILWAVANRIYNSPAG